MDLLQNCGFAINKDTLSVTLRVPAPPKGGAVEQSGTERVFVVIFYFAAGPFVFDNQMVINS